MSRIGTAMNSGPARVGAAVVALALLATITDPARAALDDDKPGRDAPAVQRTTPVPGKNVTGKAAQVHLAKDPAPRASWPQPGQRQVAVPDTVPAPGADADADAGKETGPAFARAGDWPVYVGDPDSPAARKTGAPATHGRKAPAAVTVRIADREAATAAGIPGLFLHVRPATTKGEPATAGPVAVRVDYTSFAGAYGGNWGQRLRAVQYPACVLTTPDKPECTRGHPLPTTNAAGAATVTTVLDLAGPDPGAAPTDPAPSGGASSANPRGATARTAGAAETGGGTVLALEAEPAAESEDWAATPLGESATWSTGGQSGAVTWSYPIPAPPVPGGLAPQVALSYNSQAVDGRTSGRNNQASWVGDGFDLNPGFIERKYRPCIDDQGNQDGAPPNNPALGEPGGAAPTGDLCWKSLNATLSFGGGASEIVYDEDKQYWRKVFDDGTRITRATGADNGDDNGEYWVVSTPDGLRYYFGAGPTGAGIATNSAWTVPVYGNHVGEPGHQPGDFAGSYKQQAWRWNLDHVRDLTGNVVNYIWAAETNHYNRGTDYNNKSGGTRTAYQRGGYLTRIDYGLRLSDGGTGDTVADPANPLAQVDFTAGERCRIAGQPGASCEPGDIAEHPEWWQDLPPDQLCSTGGTCTNNVATFFTRKRLDEVTTRTRPTPGGALVNVDRFRFTYADRDVLFPATLTRTALANTTNAAEQVHDNTAVTLPPVTFDSDAMDNRVNWVGDGASPLRRHRLRTVVDEAGGQLAFTYKLPECTKESVTDLNPWQNTQRCFPAEYVPPGQPATNATLHWFHKYVIGQVTRTDNSGFAAALGGASPQVITRYAYDGAAWAYDRSPLVRAEDRTWNDWRGFRTVTTTVGESGPGLQTPQQTRTTYYQGMYHDRKNTTNDDRRLTTFNDTENANIDDHWRLAGVPRETQVFNGSPDDEVTATITVPWLSDANATMRTPTFAGTDTVHGRTSITGQTAPRRTTRSFSHDAYGLVTTERDLGVAGGADDLCTTITYTRPALSKDSAWVLDRVATARTLSDCSSTPALPASLVAETRKYYDGADQVTDAPSRGLLTRTEQVEDKTGYGTPAEKVISAQTSHDAYGRVLTSTDPLGRVTTTAYTPATGPVTAVTVTSPDPDGPAGSQAPHVTTSTLDPVRGLALSATGPTGVTTRGAYDALGRLVGVWRNNRAISAELNNADVRYGYDNTPAGPEAVTTITRLDDDLGVRNVLTSVVLYDDLRRPVQNQTPGREEEGALRDGRVVTSTGYDTRGLPIIATAPAFTAGVPTGGSYWSGAEPPAITTTVYDGVGRPTQETFAAANAGPTWTTTTSYGGDRVTVTPPTGATKTTTVTDARGRMTALLQYATPADATPRRTDYTWTPAGQIASMTDPGGNTWTWTYDLLGRQVTADDPDAGQTTSTYTKTGQLRAVTDARNQVLTYAYDNLDRQRVRYNGAEDPANKLAEWTYDPVIGGTRRSGLPDASIRYLGDGPTKQEITQQVTGYDELGRPTAATSTIPAITGLIPADLAGAYTTETAYSGDGTVQSRELGSYGPAFGRIEAETLRYFNDEFGRPQAMAGAGAYVADTLRNAYGDVLRYSYGNTFRREAWQRFSYQSGTRRLTQTRIDREIDTTPFEVLNYEYDLAGNPKKIATSGQVGTETRCYNYDGFRQLTAAWTPADANCASAPSPTATPPSPTLGGIAPYANTWTFDNIGNRTSETTYRNNAAPVTTEYTYAGQTADPKFDPHQLTSLTGGGSFVYDDAGNTTERTIGGVTQTLDWDTEGRLEKVSDSTGGSPGTELARHIYGPDGERLLKRDPNGTTLYLGDTEITLNTAGTAASWQRHYTFDGQTVAVRYGNKMTDTDILIADPQNTAQHAIKTNDSQVTSRRTLPYGAVRKNDGTIGTDPAGWKSHRGFVGSTSDTATGLLRVGDRDYDPLLGRFLSLDPILDVSHPQQVNPYGYANNNPIAFADPSGRFWECDDIAASCAFGWGRGGALPSDGPGACCTPDQASQIQETGDDITRRKVAAAPVSERNSVILEAPQYDRLQRETLASLGISRPSYSVEAFVRQIVIPDLSSCPSPECVLEALTSLPGPGKVSAFADAIQDARKARKAVSTGSAFEALPAGVRSDVDDAISRAAAGKVRFPGHDGKVYNNSDGLLPAGGSYTEWTAAGAGAKRGAHRVIIEGDPVKPNSIYYWDHVNPPIRVGP